MNNDHKTEMQDITQMSRTDAHKAIMASYTTEYRDRLIIAGEAVLADGRTVELSASLWGVNGDDLNNYCCFHRSETDKGYSLNMWKRLMVIHETIPNCDHCQAEFSTPIQAYAAVAQGATGRWCVVLHMCGDCVGGEAGVLTAEQARNQIKESGMGYPDF